jgi:hypothetical protein
MTRCLPIDLREAVTEEARVASDLSRVVPFPSAMWNERPIAFRRVIQRAHHIPG